MSKGLSAVCREIAFVLLLFSAVSESAGAQQSTAPSNGSGLQGWRVEHTVAEMREGVLRVEEGNGWVRTERVYGDFILTVDVRIPADRSAALFVRAWPTFSASSKPSNGYRIDIPGVKAAAPSDGWQHLEVECIGGSVKVRADGVPVHSVEAVRNPQGHIGLSAPETTVEYKAIEIREIRPRLQPTPGAVDVRPGLVQAPKAVLMPQPRYTPDAMRARITGKVVMQGVVKPDGTIADVRILQSLDPHFGLDQVAVQTAAKWTFVPGMRDGQPVAVRVMIELEFNLK